MCIKIILKMGEVRECSRDNWNDFCSRNMTVARSKDCDIVSSFDESRSDISYRSRARGGDCGCDGSFEERDDEDFHIHSNILELSFRHFCS